MGNIFYFHFSHTNPSIEIGVSIEEAINRVKNEKRLIKKEKQYQVAEKRFALEREEILSKLSNKPVKIHPRGDRDLGRIKDIKLEGVSMALGSLELLTDINVTFSEGRKYGLIGRNGQGKTTFLKHIAGHAFPGIPKGLQILHIEQEVEISDIPVIDIVLACDIERSALQKESKILTAMSEENSPDVELIPKSEEEDEFGVLDMSPDERGQRLGEIYNRWTEIDGDRAPSIASTILSGLGFLPEMQIKPIKSFSGGWRMRVSIAQALFIDPDILLLDEPTNHLDLLSVLWLEDYLQSYSKTLIMVSHDRDFLNNVATDIIHLYNKRIIRYKGNYDAFEKQLAEHLKTQQKQHATQEKEIAGLQKFIDKNRARASTAKMAQSRVKRLEKIIIVPEIMNDPQFFWSFPEPDLLTGPLIQFIDATFAYKDGAAIYENLNFNITMETRVVLVGANGIGKSTLLKLMFGDLEPSSGMIKKNPKAKIARFTQHHVDQLDLKKTPLQWFQELYPTAKVQDLRKHLGKMGLSGTLQLQPIFSLSGGQKSRVALANITFVKPQLLLLDEPSNHLDMDTIESLIRALNNYEGGVVIVSHDEHLITSVCDDLWICENKRVIFHQGDFDDYKKALLKKKGNTTGITL